MVTNLLKIWQILSTSNTNSSLWIIRIFITRWKRAKRLIFWIVAMQAKRIFWSWLEYSDSEFESKITILLFFSSINPWLILVMTTMLGFYFSLDDDSPNNLFDQSTPSWIAIALDSLLLGYSKIFWGTSFDSLLLYFFWEIEFLSWVLFWGYSLPCLSHSLAKWQDSS